ncbi:MAG: hypothetical protein H7Z10_04630 [Gemmatimonadaceae bacterium]|nr:hypothetical protein [Acetobacteraceae bacterium]
MNMGLVINPRGTSGAGKTWLVRQVMAEYGGDRVEAVPLLRAGRRRPMGWRLSRLGGGRPLAVNGHYEATRGGADTIPEADGGMDEAVRLADTLASEGHDVLLEGLQFSGDVERTAALARAQRARDSELHVLCLDVPLDRCIRNVMVRRRAGRSARPAIERTARAGAVAMETACEALRQHGVDVQRLSLDAALVRIRGLLGLGHAVGPRANLPAPPSIGWGWIAATRASCPV